MALNATGPISLAGSTTGQSVALELGLSATGSISLDTASVRTLAGVASGAISLSNLRGKSAAPSRVPVTVTLSANTTNYTLGTAQIPGYVAGLTDVTLVINSGVYVYSTSTANAGLTIAALAAGDTVTITNNGFILGMGGQGGGWGTTGSQGTDGRPAGPAITLNRNASITNNATIAGGGGGGGGQLSYTEYFGETDLIQEYYEHSGGGGAGGGRGGSDWDTNIQGTGGGPGLSGGNGGQNLQTSSPTMYFFYGGGGGGRIVPGTGGASGTSASITGKGGGAGGGGAAWQTGAAGGSGGAVGESTASANWGGGGGGGWGAAGGSAGTTVFYTPINRAIGGAGGKAVSLNGFTATWIATGTRYGAIS